MPSKAKPVRSPVVEEKFNPRVRILDAATKAFITIGFGNARLSQIAIDAGVSRSALYGNFTSKEDLLVAINHQLIEEALQVAKMTLMKDGNAAEAIHSWLVAGVNITDRYRNLLKIMHQDEARPSLLIDREATLEAIKSFHKTIRQVLKRGIDNGEFRADIDINVTARALQSFQYLLTKQATEPHPIIDMTTGEGEVCIDFLMQGLLNSISSRSKSVPKKK